ISRAQKSIYILGGLIFKDEIPELKESLNKAIKKEVHVRIILPPFNNVDNDNIDIYQEICELECEIKTFKIPLVKVVIRDEKEMIMAVSKIKDKKIISHSAIGIWNQYSELVETMGGLYNIIWTTELFNKL
ncbi:MAG: TrmB family transcriptional regulator, partial [Methanobacterium sp.]